MKDIQEQMEALRGNTAKPSPHPHPLFHTHHFFHSYLKRANSLFGDDWFALKAESFARFFGTPLFLVAQTVIVFFWIALNVVGFFKFDLYPFILLNLAFSTQAAYAAPLILLAQTRQADRDKVHMEADAQHREEIANEHAQRLALAALQTDKLLELVQQNTQLTELTKTLAHKIEALTVEMHLKMVQSK